MVLRFVPDDLFGYLFDRVSGAHFEDFAKQLFAVVYGETFIPLGGIHDGGADGALSSYIQELNGKSTTFVQFSVTALSGTKAKLSATIDALKKSGRDPRQLIYATSTSIPLFDQLTRDLFDAHGVLIQIRDLERIKSYVNSNPRANQIFYASFRGEIDSLSRAAGLNLPTVSQFANDPTVYVFLNHELRDRFSRDHLNDRVLDALIYWALRDTNPDKNVLMPREAVKRAVGQVFPPARAVLVSRLDDRLAELSKKSSAGTERLRYYKESDSFCLPFEMRAALAAEASSMVLSQEAFRGAISSRVSDEIGTGLSDKEAKACADLVFATVHRYFVEQGLLLAAFLERRLEGLQLSDQIVEDTMVEALAGIDDAKAISPLLFGACLGALRGVFYRCSEVERRYLTYLSRTACLLVTLRSAPKLLEYMNQMAGNFRLLVGTEMLVKALSERYLEPEYQQVSNLLRIGKQLGAELILTEPVLTEVFTHLHAADLEFRNHYAEQEPYLKAGDLAECNRIMIRAYLYAKRSEGGPKSWRDFVDQMTNPDGLRTKSIAARDELRALLVQRFGMVYLSSVELEHSVPRERVVELGRRLQQERPEKHADLSYNDALMVYATYAQRRRLDEAGIYDGFGFRTWWLTKETQILSLTGEIVHSEGGVPYIMRPEFLLNFIALAPRAADVRKAFASLLPTTAGLQLGQHLSADVMHGLMRDVHEWHERTPERVSVMLSERVNRLKHDRFKRYMQNLQ